MGKVKRLTYLLMAAISALIAFIVFSKAVGGATMARAATAAYSPVLEDLLKDENFNIADYPNNPRDYSLKVIQLAESTDGELLLYVYQPSGSSKNYTATTARISTETGDNAQWKDYPLTLLNSSGVFYKYVVEGLKVSSEPVRFYDVAAIHRAFDNKADKPTGNDNEINDVVFEVAQLWTASMANGKVSYNMTTTEVVTITDKYVDFLRYLEGYWLWADACDSHYVAFSANYDIDRLFEAEVYYESIRIYHEHADLTNKDKYSYGEYEYNTVTLSELDTAHTTVTGIGGRKHNWQRIQSVKDFIASEDLKDETKEQLKDKQWVLRFADTDFKKYAEVGLAYTGYSERYTEVRYVTILRLYFEADGKTYNLGVVDNKQTGDDEQGNNPDTPSLPDLPGLPSIKGNSNNMPWWGWVIIGALAIFVILLIVRDFIKK